jgi:DNA-binding winged helix-turn-helix (wHTH) protein/TolB-like protein/Flp pilus assembly protein TadD
MAREIKHLYKFGPFSLDAGQCLLLRDGNVVQLTPKASELLLVLVQSGGRLLSKEDLLRQVWPDSFVEEANLSHNIYKLREVLGDGADGQKYIETLPRRGYRFVAPVEEIDAGSGDVVAEEHSRARIVIEEEMDDAATTGPPKSGRMKVAIASGAFLLLLAALAFFLHGSFAGHGGAISGQIRSIAVLPFKPLTPQDRDETLELGMADTLIMRLGSLQQVTVRPLSAVRKFTALDQDAMEAGRQLQVEAVLEGNVQKSGDRVRVTARLFRLSDGTQLWADKYDQRFTDVFALQDSIAERVAARMSQKLAGGENYWAKRGTENTEAYLLYMRGRYYWSTFQPEKIGESIQYFKAAIEKDPNYALAYAGLANAYSVAGIYGPLTPDEAFPLAKEAAQQALRLDDNLSEAHQALGGNKLLRDWDWEGAARELQRAIELDPNNLNAHELHGYYFEAMGRPEDALREMRRAVEIDPGWIICNNDLTIALNQAGRYDEAILQGEKTRRLNPSQPSSEAFLGYAYLQKHRFDDAIAAFQHAIKLASEDQRDGAVAGLAYAYAVSGHRTEALTGLAELEKHPDKNIRMSGYLAGVYAGLGDKDRAFAMLERARLRRDPRMWYLKLDQRFENLHSDPRFRDLLRSMGMPE